MGFAEIVFLEQLPKEDQTRKSWSKLWNFQKMSPMRMLMMAQENPKLKKKKAGEEFPFVSLCFMWWQWLLAIAAFNTDVAPTWRVFCTQMHCSKVLFFVLVLSTVRGRWKKNCTNSHKKKKIVAVGAIFFSPPPCTVRSRFEECKISEPGWDVLHFRLRSFLHFCRTWTKRYLITSLNVFDSRLRGDQVPLGSSPTKISKKTFRVGGPQAPFSFSSSFILFFVLFPFFLKQEWMRSYRTRSCQP